MASNPENEPRASREVEKPPIEPILPPMVEEMHDQDIWNNCAVHSVISGVMGVQALSSANQGEFMSAIAREGYCEQRANHGPRVFDLSLYLHNT